MKDKQYQQASSQEPPRRKKRTQINKIRNERREVITDITEILKIIRKYYEQLCQQIGQPRRNRQVSRSIKPAKTKSRRNR